MESMHDIDQGDQWVETWKLTPIKLSILLEDFFIFSMKVWGLLRKKHSCQVKKSMQEIRLETNVSITFPASIFFIVFMQDCETNEETGGMNIDICRKE